MKVVLLYWPSADQSEYGEKLFSGDETEYHLPIDSAALLPAKSEIHLIDETTGEGIDLLVTKWHFDPDHNLLRLQVVVDVPGCEIGPEDFKKYIQRKWTFGNSILE